MRLLHFILKFLKLIVQQDAASFHFPQQSVLFQLYFGCRFKQNNLIPLILNVCYFQLTNFVINSNNNNFS